MRSAFVCLLVAGAALAEPAVAQSNPTPVLREGDIIPGVGVVTRIDNVAINNNGDWLVEADTDFADTNADSVLVRNGVLYLRENDALPLPSGATLDTFDSIGINNNGSSGWNFFLDSDLPSDRDSGIYFNTHLVIQEGDISTAPEFSPGTPYIGFFDAKMNDMNTILVVASIDDPAISSSVDRALVRVQVTPSGNLVSESVLAKEGDVLPGQVEPVADFGTGPHQSAINGAGQVLYFADLAGPTATDGAIYLDTTLLAQEGGPSPVAGRAYDFLSSRGLDLNNAGGYVFKASLEGDTSDDDLIVLNGAVFLREGDTLPAINPFHLTSFGTGSGPVRVDDAGSVLWFGDWDDPDTNRDTGLFLNDRLLVQEGVTTIGGLVVDTISSGSDAFALSESGEFIIFEATLEGSVEGAFTIRISQGGPNEPPVARCQNVTVAAGEGCLADASIDAGSFDPDGDPITLSQSPPGPYTVGTTEVTLTVTDDKGASDTCTGTVTVIDETSPEISAVLSPDMIWPPNHRMVTATAVVDASDDCSVPVVILELATSSEPDNGEGDGDTVNDIQEADVGTADFELLLRAERSGTGDGRVYTVVYTATDSSGNQASASATAVVPHDQGGKTDPLDESVSETDDGTMVEWNEVPGARFYDLIRGTLSQVSVGDEVISLGSVVCIQTDSNSTSSAGQEDPELPAAGEIFFYLVQYNDGTSTGFGTESAPKPRIVGSGGCR